MSLEDTIFGALKNLVSGRVHRDIAPPGATVPYITFQQVGGEEFDYLEGGSVGLSLARVQVNCWDDSRDDVNALALAVRNALQGTSSLQTNVLGAFITVLDEQTGLYGTIQDFRLKSS